MIGAGGLVVVSFGLSLWLAYAFRRISLMPPDMNPLEDNLTARPKHKKGRSSTTTLTSTESEKRLSTPGDRRSQFGKPNEEASRPTSVPFMHTRARSDVSFGLGAFGANSASRQYQIVPGNSPRNSATTIESKRTSRPASSWRGSYAEVPLQDSSPISKETSQHKSLENTRAGKFTEAWAPTNSLVSRTNHRYRRSTVVNHGRNAHAGSYAALTDRDDAGDSSDSEYEDQNYLVSGIHEEIDLSQGNHPNPLTSNPPPDPLSMTKRAQTPFYPRISNKLADEGTLCELSPNHRQVSGSRDIADEVKAKPARPWNRNRNSSIQPEADFYAKSYGELKSATPPVMVGNDRKVSSGNDYDANKSYSIAYERRNVSGKIAEEGRAANRSSGYGYYLNRKS